MSTLTCRVQAHGVTVLQGLAELAEHKRTKLREHLQDSHTHHEPEILLTDDVFAADVPRLGVFIPAIAKDSKDPCAKDTLS